jgi:hypothetical protein
MIPGTTLQMNQAVSLLAGSLLWSGFSISATGGSVYYPQPGLVDDSTGLMESLVAGDWYRGTAVVARDPKLLFSCAHLFFESGEWATDYHFYRANHSKSYPDELDAASPRGLHYFTSYSSGVKSFGSDSNQAFASDFTVFYGNSAFGPAVAGWSNGGPALRSSSPKRIVGYPIRTDFTGVSGHCYQHATDWFNYQAFRLYGGYHEFDDVSTGPGNSGGPIYVQNAATGADLLAGILVSGTKRTAGIKVLDITTETMASRALGLESRTVTFKNLVSSKLPDGSKAYTVMPIRVSGFSGAIEKLKLSLSIATKRRGDLDVYLRSPNGRIRWISRHSGGMSDNLEIKGLNLSDTFSGTSANGTWELRMRDATVGTRATFLSASLRVSAL